FGAHFGNWELPAVCAAACKVDTAVLYRRPNNPAIDKWLHNTRTTAMGKLIPTGLDAPMKLADALRRGAHVGMIVDQYYTRGVDVTFFGQRTKANPLLARLARHFDCPIHGLRVVRLPGHRFRSVRPEIDGQAGAPPAAHGWDNQNGARAAPAGDWPWFVDRRTSRRHRECSIDRQSYRRGLRA